MDKVETPERPATDAFDSMQIADAQALFSRALEMSENDWEAAEELFEKSFDGMLEQARDGDRTAQYNVALMYVYGINEPYDDNYQRDTKLLMEWVHENEDELQEYLQQIDDWIDDLEKRVAGGDEFYNEASHDPEGNDETDHDRDAKKLRRLYMLKTRLERQGFSTGANVRAGYQDHDHED